MHSGSTIRSLCLCAAAALAAVEQPVGWHGDGTGVFADQNPPTTWSDNSNVDWRVRLPNWSNSSPIVADGRAYLTSEPREASPELLCYDAKTGKDQGVFLTHGDLIINSYRVWRLMPDGDDLTAEILHCRGRPALEPGKIGTHFHPAQNKACNDVLADNRNLHPFLRRTRLHWEVL